MTSDFFILMKSELSLVFIIFLLLILKVSDVFKSNSAFSHFSNVLLVLNFVFGFLFNSEGTLFNGMFYTNSALALEKNILNFGVLVICLQAFDWLKTHKHVAEFYILLLSTLLGMFYMISSGHFLMFYLGLELASIPLAALANFDLEKRKSSEAAMKLILSSAFASGILLFGISLLYGATGSLLFSEMPMLITDSPLQVVSLIFIFTGFAFKLSVVPFHFWTADVYEGAPVAVTSFLSVISKAAMVFVFISILMPLFASAKDLFYLILLLSIVLTISIGNLFAIRQDNIKRFLAFSSIAQVGYMLLAFTGTAEGARSALQYNLIAYGATSFAFYFVISLIGKNRPEEIHSLQGLSSESPGLAALLVLCMFSLVGIPPLAGFLGKFLLFSTAAQSGHYVLVLIAAMNAVISFYYYMRLLKEAYISKPATVFAPIQLSRAAQIWTLVLAILLLVLGTCPALGEYIAGRSGF